MQESDVMYYFFGVFSSPFSVAASLAYSYLKYKQQMSKK